MPQGRRLLDERGHGLVEDVRLLEVPEGVAPGTTRNSAVGIPAASSLERAILARSLDPQRMSVGTATRLSLGSRSSPLSSLSPAR
jgi:hypothetical protein